MAKRLSSLFSLGSNASDQGNKNPPPPPSALDAGPAAKAVGHNKLVRRSTPDLRALTPPTVLQAVQNPSQPPVQQTPVDTSLLTPQTFSPLGDSALLTQSPIAWQRPESPADGRPVSRGSARVPSRDGTAPHSRAASPAKFTRPLTPTGDIKYSKRLSWLPGRGGSIAAEGGVALPSSSAWIVTPRTEDNVSYDIAPLADFQKVPDLWNDTADTYIYLHSRESTRGPSFKIDSSLFSASRKLAAVAYGGTSNYKSRTPSQPLPQEHQRHRAPENANSRNRNDAESASLRQQGSSSKASSTGTRSASDFLDEKMPRHDIHLCMPSPLQADLADPNAKLSESDVDVLITMRNVFAFLSGKPLVATSRYPTLFSIFVQIASVLRHYEFSNLDGSTFGEEVLSAFNTSVRDFAMADVRQSREKTIEAIVLGEKMKYWPLYNEGFVHAVGKHDEIVNLRSSKFCLISDISRKRMERSTLDLSVRLLNLRTRLQDFEFPSLFAGFAQSSTSTESKIIRFKAWKSAYLSMRRHVITYYKSRYGAWPPKARSKKNDFEESGLNRLLLKDLYNDFSDLYDILVDRTSMTTRHIEVQDQGDEGQEDEPVLRSLRRILSEYDRSVAPVQPPVPFDAPLLPSLQSCRRNFASLEPRKQQKESAKKLEHNEINTALLSSINKENLKSTPFILAFMEYERKWATGKSIEELADLRMGQWIFMYAVIQALPLVVIDAPDLQFTQGIEYFLCQVPLGGATWLQESHAHRQSWYGVSGSTGLVALPTHIVEHGVRGIYHRSHCWQMAGKWAKGFDDEHPNGNLESDAAHPEPDISREPISNHPSADRGRNPSVTLSPSDHSAPQFTTHPASPPLTSSSIPHSPALSPITRPRRPSSSLNLASLGLGLEALPLPANVKVTAGADGITADSPSSPTVPGAEPGAKRSTKGGFEFDPNRNFDAILAGTAAGAGRGDKKKRGRGLSIGRLV